MKVSRMRRSSALVDGKDGRTTNSASDRTSRGRGSRDSRNRAGYDRGYDTAQLDMTSSGEGGWSEIEQSGIFSWNGGGGGGGGLEEAGLRLDIDIAMTHGRGKALDHNRYVRCGPNPHDDTPSIPSLSSDMPPSWSLPFSWPWVGGGSDGWVLDVADRETVRRYASIALCTFCTVLLFADQNLMAPNLTAMARDFGFYDNGNTETVGDTMRDEKLGGDIALAFFLVGAPASFAIGCLADQEHQHQPQRSSSSRCACACPRITLLSVVVALGAAASIATSLVTTYSQLYVARATTGASVGAAVPLLYSLLGDWVAAADRHVVSATISLGTGGGIATGQLLAGLLGHTERFGWRLPFFMIGLPAVVCAVLLGLLVDEPPRGGMEAAVLQAAKKLPLELHSQFDDIKHNAGRIGEPKPFGNSTSSAGKQLSMPSEPPDVPFDESDMQTNIQAPRGYTAPYQSESDGVMKTNASTKNKWLELIATTRHLLSTPTVVLAILQGAPGCIPWGVFNVFLNDYLSQDCGYSVETATSILLWFSIGNGLGLIAGGASGRSLYARDVRYPSLVAGCTAVLGCPPFWALLRTVHAETTPYLYAALVSFVTGLCSAPTGPIIKATVTNVTLPWTRGQAFALFALCDDLGKGLGPFFVARLIKLMGGRRAALSAGVWGWVLCGVFNIAIFFTVARDEERVQEGVATAVGADFNDDDDDEDGSSGGSSSSSSSDENRSLALSYNAEQRNTSKECLLRAGILRTSTPSTTINAVELPTISIDKVSTPK